MDISFGIDDLLVILRVYGLLRVGHVDCREP
jgi:hypothetical protein